MGEQFFQSQTSPSNAPVVAPTRRNLPVWVLAILLALMTTAVFIPVVHYDFIGYDDPMYISENARVQAGLSWGSFKWAFCNPVCAHWHPMTVLSLMTDCQLFGLKPGGTHLVNVLLHSINVALVFILLRQLTGAKWRSLFVAMMFAVLPVNVGTVAWVAERKNVLSTCFGLLTLIFYARYAMSQQPVSNQRSGAGLVAVLTSWLQSPAYLMSFLCLALGLMSKAMLVTWPFVMLLLDFWPLGRFELRNGVAIVGGKDSVFCPRPGFVRCCYYH